MSPDERRTHLVALGQAIFVTVLWSSSWVLIKIGLKDIPALPFVGLRYMLAFLCLAPIVLLGRHRSALFTLDRGDLTWLAALGLVQITLTQGAQFLTLMWLPATSASLILSFSPAVVALLSGLFLGERILGLQWAGIGVFMLGAAAYFAPKLGAAGMGAPAGYVAVGVCLAANATQTLLGRQVNRESRLPASVVTVVSMGIGAAVLLAGGVAVQGWPDLSLRSWLLILWLAVANTAFAFILWNHVQRVLTAMESSLINNTMMVPIAILAVLFLGERLGPLQVAGLGIALAGALAVQLPKLMKGR
jgi:drug/metabolite transporter (DMT)-like permease